MSTLKDKINKKNKRQSCITTPEGLLFLRRTGVSPKNGMAIPATRREIGPCRTEIDRVNGTFMPEQCVLSYGAVNIPENRCCIVRDRGNELSIRGIDNATDAALVGNYLR